MPPDRPSPGCSSPVRPLGSRPILPGSSAMRSRRGCAGSRRSGRRPVAFSSRPSSAASRCRSVRISERSSRRPIGTRSLGADRRRVRPLPPATQPRRLRVRPPLLLGPSLLAGPDADRDSAALRAASEPPARSRPAAGLQRLGVPGAAAPSCPLGRLIARAPSRQLRPSTRSYRAAGTLAWCADDAPR